MKRKALIFGATGLTGSFLVEQLCDSEVYEEVVSFSRRRISFEHPKLRELISDLKNPEEIKTEITGDDLFCCLGTTIKKAGNKKNFRHVDHDLPVALSKIAEQNKIKRFLVISSIGANSKSSNFYLRTKGEMEDAVLDASIPQISV
ncbi:MAG: NAD(P)H-binding protein, partial [Bacteroidales bacterium]